MGTLGQYLRSAREAKDIDLRDAAQQTRISINYLRALEEEDFSKLPGEVFVRGFLKNYVRFLNLDEAETLKIYAELKPQPVSQSQQSQSQLSSVAATNTERAPLPNTTDESKQETPVEPFVWGAVICIALLVFLFSSLPSKDPETVHQPENQALLMVPGMVQQDAQASKPEKLYLEVVALKDTWLLVRTDTSPQKKAVLKKGESLIWSADDRFLLSYGQAGDVKLLLNGEEIIVKGASETPIRDLAITRAGVVSQPVVAKQSPPANPKPKPAAKPQQQPSQTAIGQQPAPSPAPESTAPPAAAAPSPAPASTQSDTVVPQIPAQ